MSRTMYHAVRAHRCWAQGLPFLSLSKHGGEVISCLMCLVVGNAAGAEAAANAAGVGGVKEMRDVKQVSHARTRT